MSFKDVKPTSWEHCLGGIAGVLADAFGEHAYLATEGALDPADSAVFAGKPGVALELKRVATERGETKQKALATALRQIRTKDYAAELRSRGAAPIHEVAVAFEGKRAHVRVASER